MPWVSIDFFRSPQGARKVPIQVKETKTALTQAVPLQVTTTSFRTQPEDAGVNYSQLTDTFLENQINTVKGQLPVGRTQGYCIAVPTSSESVTAANVQSMAVAKMTATQEALRLLPLPNPVTRNLHAPSIRLKLLCVQGRCLARPETHFQTRAHAAHRPFRRTTTRSSCERSSRGGFAK